MRPVLLLARMHDTDQALDSVKFRLDEITSALKEPHDLRRAKRAQADSEAALAACRRAGQECEQAQQAAAAKLARVESHLYSGEMRNPKELEGAEMDLKQSRRQLREAEDALLAAQIACEEAEATHASNAQKVQELGAIWEEKQRVLLAERDKLQAVLPGLEARRASARRGVPETLLALYDQLRVRRGGKAVAPIDGDACGECRVAVPPSKLESALYGEELVYCDNCGRLIWGE